MGDKLNIIWSGCRPEYIGVGPNMKTACESGVKQVSSVKELGDFMSDISVDYGEQGGSSKIHGAFRGSCEDLMKGKSAFIPTEKLNRMVREEDEDGFV